MASDAAPMAAHAVRPRTMEPEIRVARLGTRIGGYAVDMVIFAAVAMLSVVTAGATLLFLTDGAQHDPSDPDIYVFLGIIALATPLVWSALNVLLVTRRGQTGGQYVAGLRLQREDGTRPSLRTAAAWWFCLNPLLFSWPMALVVGFPLAALVALVLDDLTLVLFSLVVILCAASPIVAFVSAAVDARNRALHDRVAGVVAVPAAQD